MLLFRNIRIFLFLLGSLFCVSDIFTSVSVLFPSYFNSFSAHENVKKSNIYDNVNSVIIAEKSDGMTHNSSVKISELEESDANRIAYKLDFLKNCYIPFLLDSKLYCVIPILNLCVSHYYWFGIKERIIKPLYLLFSCFKIP